jgi:VCBS repeat-containing protein
MPVSQVTFDFTVGAPSGTSMVFSQSGLSVTVSSALYYGNSDDPDHIAYEFSSPTLSTNELGIGALNTYQDLDDGFDAHGKYEMVTFSFGQDVKITSIKLIPVGTSYNPTGVDTQFVIFDQGLLIDQASKQFIDSSDFINDVSVFGRYLGFGAVNQLDSFRVAAITVEIVAVDVITTVADSYGVKTSDAPVTLDVLANDSNVQVITSIDTTSVLGSVTLAADGRTLVYNAGSAFDYLAKDAQATETFTYTALGTDGSSETQTVTVTVTGNPNLVDGTAGRNNLTGTGGRDIIQGFAGNDTIHGGMGNDDVYGGADRDRVFGDDGNDRVDGGDGDDYVFGDAGNDTVIGGAGNDRLNGGDGNDSLDGSVGSDRLYGDAGNDVLVGGSSANIMDGGTGVDTMTGGGGNDSYYVDQSTDVIIELALGGADLVRSTVSYTLSDYIENIVLKGADAIDATGNSLSNRLVGNAASNVLVGLGGNDRLDGGVGDDRLISGTGRDIVTGGADHDDFVFAEFGTANYDQVTDFNAAFDTIQLSATAFGLDVGALDATEFAFGTKATNATQRIIYDQAHGDLYYDADGNGAGARQLIASLVDGTVLTFDDIFAF